MKEDFLHFVWKFQKFSLHNLQTTQGESIEIAHPGDHNLYSGPDFMAAKIKLGSLLWKTHYTFTKESTKREKRLSTSFIELLFINTIIPFYFCYQKAMGKDPSEKVIHWIRSLPAEKNAFSKGFSAINVSVEDALDSQALIQLKQQYCELKKCLLCPVGVYLLKQ